MMFDWRDRSHFASRLARCRLCGGLTPLRDDSDRPCHKVCAEQEAQR